MKNLKVVAPILGSFAIGSITVSAKAQEAQVPPTGPNFGAQSTAKSTPEGVYIETPSGPRALPGDILLPFNILADDGRIVTVGPRPGEDPPYTAVGPGLELSLALAHAAVDVCVAGGQTNVGAAVVDTAGRLRASMESEKGDGSHVFVAQRKAVATVAFGGAPSIQLIGMIQRDPSLMKKVTPNMFLNIGALPIMKKGKLVGALAVSGAHGSANDQDCAKAALDKLAGKLR